jgi:hypothetical protein
MKPRSAGGGFAGLGDSALNISQAYGNAQSQKLYRQSQMEELQSRADERAAKIAQAKYQAEQRRRLMLEAGGGPPQDAGMQGAVPHEAMVMPESLAAQGVKSRFNSELEQAAKSQGGGQVPANGKPYQLKVMEYVNAGYSDEMAKILANKDSGRQEVARTVEIPGPNGPMIQQLSKTGDPIGNPIPKAVAMKFLALGDRQFGVNEHTGQPTGASFAVGQSPDSRASNATTIRGQNLTDARGNEALRIQREAIGSGKPPTGYRIGRDGLSLEFIPGGPADPAAKEPAEDAKKAAGYAIRMEDALSTLQNIGAKNPSALTPGPAGLAANAMRMLGADSAANQILPEDRQRVEAAQLDALDAALTLGTGAAYTKEQLEGYRRSLFPQAGDGEQTKADKQARLQKVIETARIRAGILAPRIDSMRQPSYNTGTTAGGQIKPAGRVFSQRPDPSSANGRTIVDHDTGQKYRSNGSTWEPVQ